MGGLIRWNPLPEIHIDRTETSLYIHSNRVNFGLTAVGVQIVNFDVPASMISSMLFVPME